MSFIFTAATNGKPGFTSDVLDVDMLDSKPWCNWKPRNKLAQALSSPQVSPTARVPAVHICSGRYAAAFGRGRSVHHFFRKSRG